MLWLIIVPSALMLYLPDGIQVDSALPLTTVRWPSPAGLEYAEIMYCSSRSIHR